MKFYDDHRIHVALLTEAAPTARERIVTDLQLKTESRRLRISLAVRFDRVGLRGISETLDAVLPFRIALSLNHGNPAQLVETSQIRPAFVEDRVRPLDLYVLDRLTFRLVV